MFAVKVDKNIASIVEKEQITSGSQNVYVTQFEFSDEWQYLERTARFRGGDKVIDILLDDTNKCMIPWEVMTKAKVTVEVGAYGVKDGNVVLPTVWASMPIVLQSVLGEDDSAWPSEPTPDVYQQILARLGDLEDKIAEGGTGGGGSGQNGKDGKDGKSAYQIAVDNGFEGTEEEWLASLQGPPGKDGSDADVINRCLWVCSAGDDIDLFKNGETNVAAPNEFIGHTPTVSNNNVGLVLVDSKLYWTKFDITAVAEHAVTQSFTKDPVLIGPVAGGGGNVSDSTLFVVNYNRAPKVGDYFNITPDRMYGAIPKNGEDYTLVAFTTDGIFDCTCVVTDYTPGKWATQVKVTTVSGVNSYSKEQIDEMFAGITIEDPLVTFKDTTITNISQLPVDKTPCCFHMVDSTLGFPFKDDIIYVKCVDPIVFVYTIDGAVAELDVGPEGQLTVKQVSSVRGDPGESAYDIAVSNGFEGTEAEWLESLKGPKGDTGESAYYVAVANGFEGTEAEWLESLKGPTGDSGESAYDVAVANGFEGTEAEWLESLKGPKGDTGESAPEEGAILIKPITEAEYEALSNEEKNSETGWLLTDGETSIPIKSVTEAEYDALSDEEKEDDIAYLVTDAESGGSSDSSTSKGEVYSTEEVRIGTWIDGKPLYRRVITGLTFSSGEAKEYASYGKTALQIDTVVGLAGTAFVDTGEVVSLPYTDFSSVGGALAVDLHLQIKDDALLVVNRNANTDTKWKASSAIAILEYTKTTD